MTILDRYILRSFLFNFVGWCFCFVGIFVVFDLFTNFDSLIRAGTAAGNVLEVIFFYYFFKSIPIVLMIGSVLSLVSAMVTVAMLMRNNEFVPIQAAGISTLRIIRPLIIAVFCLTALFCGMREFLLPNIQDRITMEASDYAVNKGTLLNMANDRETNIDILGDRVFRSGKRITEPEFVFPRTISRQPLRLTGESAFHQSATKAHPAGYLLTEVHDKHVLHSPSIMWEGKPILLTPEDTDFLEPDQCFVVTNLPFESLASTDAWKYASVWSLVSAARNKSLDVGNTMHATIHSRLTQPVLDMSLLFLGLPVILLCGDRNVFKAVGMSGLILIAFLVVCYSCQYAGANSGMPVLGAWLPMMIFVPIAVNQYYLLRET
ncbi:MAG: LptF/LptG family permease [Planctomycetaceae bacterium]|jgi:lipopolysaccharide export system permease protein|nr:LptF/LptG family permease [Planctomycetaceae bacterium]